MEKSNRGRRNGGGGDQAANGSQTDAANSKSTDASAGTSATAQARRRIEEAAATASVVEKANAMPGLQDTFVDERNDVLAVINELEDQLDRQQEIRETLERELTTSAEKLQNANQKVQELEWHAVTLQTRVDALEQVRQQATLLEEELGDAHARSHQLKDQLTTTEKERARLKHELKTANKQVDELWAVRKERDGLRADYKTLSLKVEDLERAQREMFEERGQLQGEIQELQAQVESITGERNEYQMTAKALEDRIRELVQVQESMSDSLEKIRAEKKTLQAQITHLERENTRLVEQRQFYECEVTSLRNQNRTAEAALASVKKAFGEVRVALTDTKARARRRAVDNWPRIGSTLRGLDPETDEAVNAAVEGETTGDDPETRED